MQSQAPTVAAYLKSLPAERRVALEAVRAAINDNLDRDGYEEGMSYGMICWVVPHRVFPAGYHCNPAQALPFAALASQKNYCSVYVPLVVPADLENQGQDSELYRWFVDAWKKSGKKLDMGKCCIRFKRAEDLALDVLGELIRRVPVERFVASYLAAREGQLRSSPRSRGPAKAKAAAKREPAPSKQRSGRKQRG